MDKKKIRSEINALRKMLSENDVEYLSGRIIKNLAGLDIYKASDVIYAFISYEKEVQTRKIIKMAWRDGKKVAVPKIPDGRNMVFHYIESFDNLETGFGGILEPSYDNPADCSSALMLVPGLAFDYDLNRIGSGGGFYDKYLFEHKEDDLIKVALAYDFQICKKLDVIEEHDEPINMIVTPTMIIS